MSMATPIGEEMYRWAGDLFPICRSITGHGVRQTLRYFQKILPELTICEVPSGTPAFDWTVPDEWNIRDAYVMDDQGVKVIDFNQNNVHVVGYSTPVDSVMTLEELEPYLHSLPHLPEAIPYLTSYYRPRWGFCLSHRARQELKPGRYRVVIDSTLAPGSLTYGELILPGREEREILLSTYTCHPSLANDNLSGPLVTTALAQELAARSDRRYTYRIVYIPETIGSLVYLSRHLDRMKRTTLAGFVLTCVGDDRSYSFLPSRMGNTLADRVAGHVLKHRAPGYATYSFLDRGSDERQYCSVGIDLPVVSLMRTMYGVFPEYHTSLDNLSLISPSGLGGAYQAILSCLDLLEENYTYRMTCPGEPQLGKRGLYPTLSTRENSAIVRNLSNVMAYADGDHDLIALAERTEVFAEELLPVVKSLFSAGLLEKVD
ncbi:MAG: DUF4910 domain-containing protein [Deltaproteobacteria bacterium]|nr:DUF4910 domain-containing protein [Deltaproteobacteria bacterium]